MTLHWYFLFLVFLTSCYNTEAGTFSVDYTNHQFLKDGKPFRYISGSIHYMRVHPDQWNDRLQRIRALGLNAVQVYVPWNMQETFQGNYINAVQNYYNVLLDVVKPLLYKNGGPILMVQVENEYGYGPCDHKYTAFLRDLIWSKLGNDTVLYTSPNVCSEYWVDWYTQWGVKAPGAANPSQVIDNINHMFIHWNASFNIYMIHGGTNFGFMAGADGNGGAPSTTSYDYGAAIAENGDITPVYLAIRSYIQNISGWEQPPLAIPSNNPASNYGQVPLKRVGTSLVSTLIQIQEACSQSTDPLTFESIDHPYGFVLYTATLSAGGKTLVTPNIKDYGYVFVNNNYQGLHNNVTLDNTLLQNWFQCGINLTKPSVDSLISGSFNEDIEDVLPEKATTAPGVYVGQFTASVLQDTFFDSTGWGKGVLFINGYNLGRYWPTVGPQIALYIPKPYIQQTNTVLLIELVGAQQNYANFVDHAMFKNI
uniref:Glycoside hydrolase 35 catalytic domain-containing protein n=1 Tax=Acrobeloides nanus TaxID=290746 RepID=A0A914E6E1_9BILA